MQAGDLADGPLADILRALSAAGATGGVHVQRRDAAPGAPRTTRDAVLFLRDGKLYAATSPGPRPLLGVRLVSAGAVTRDALEEALESQAGELAGWRLGELLVHLGYVDAEIVTEFVIEQILDTVAEVSSWPAGSWRFRRGERTREADDLSLDIEDVLEQVAERLAHWSNLAAWGSKADAVPTRVSFDEALESAQMPLARTLLREVDGHRSLSELAVRCGLTTFEAGQVLALLVESGAVQVLAGGGTARTSAGPEADGQPLPVQPAVDQVEPAGTTPTDTTPTDTTETAWAADGSAAPAAPAAPAAADDDLAALLGGGEDDLGLQLAVLARQAADAQYAVEQRRHEEQVARRTGTPVAVEPVAVEPVSAEHIDLAPLDPGQPAQVAAVPPLAPDPVLEAGEVATPAGATTEAADRVPALAPAEPAAYAQIPVEALPGVPVLVEVVDDAPADADPLDLSADLPPSAADLDAWAAAVADGSGSRPADDPSPDLADLAGPSPAVVHPPHPVGPRPAVPAPPTLAPVWPAPEVEEAEQFELPPAAHVAGHITAPGHAVAAPLAPDAEPELEVEELPAAIAEPGQQAALRAALSEVALTDFAPVASPVEPTEEPEVAAVLEVLQALPPTQLWGQHDDFSPGGDSSFADTASLLRELSSLGLDDAPSVAPAARTPTPRTAAAGAAKPKRKSIFGR